MYLNVRIFHTKVIEKTVMFFKVNDEEFKQIINNSETWVQIGEKKIRI